MFAQNFQYQKVLPNADLGIHEVTIQKVYYEKVSGIDCLTAEITYEKGQQLMPDKIRFFDLSPNASEESKKAFNYKMSAFCDCFEFHDGFSELELANLIGKCGMVNVVRDKNGYIVVNRFIPR